MSGYFSGILASQGRKNYRVENLNARGSYYKAMLNKYTMPDSTNGIVQRHTSCELELPSSARCLYWSRMKVASFCSEKKIYGKKRNDLAFHPGPVETPSGEGSPLLQGKEASLVL